MKDQKISTLQAIFLIANFIFSSAVISLPQIVVEIGGQNAWITPIILYPLVLVMIYVLFGKKGNFEHIQHLFSIDKKKGILEKGFVIFFFLMVLFVFLRDLRGEVDFIATVLLPTTPIDVLMILSILVICYIAMSGIEIIARVNAIYFGILIIIVVMLPFLLFNEIDIRNLQPLPNLQSMVGIFKGIIFSISWVGELLLILIVITNVTPIGEARKAVMIGSTIGVLLFALILFLELAVLGTKIVREATYPTFIMIQQINWTDFLDRLDPIIVVVWLPTIITKVTYLLYAVNHCFSYFYKSNTNKFLFPLSIILGYLSILLFKNNMDHLHFSFYTWSSLGFLLEFVVVLLFIVVRKLSKKKAKHQELSKLIEESQQ